MLEIENYDNPRMVINNYNDEENDKKLNNKKFIDELQKDITFNFESDVSHLNLSSYKKVKAICQYKKSEKCMNIVNIGYYSAITNIKKNEKFMCSMCANDLHHSGNNNPNCRYHFDHSMFKNVTPQGAYLLGFIASDGTISKNTWSITIAIHQDDLVCLKMLRDIVCHDIPIKEINKKSTYGHLYGFTINSKEMCLDACRWFQVNRGKKSFGIRLPDFNSADLTWHFLRGYLDGDGSIRTPGKKPTPECSYKSHSKMMLQDVGQFSQIPHKITEFELRYYGEYCQEYLDMLYNNCGIYRMERKYQNYLYWKNWKKTLPGKGMRLGTNLFMKTNINAILPTKIFDGVYYLSICKVHQVIDKYTTIYDTGIKLILQKNEYAISTPESLFIDGYYLTQNVIVNHGAIDNIYIMLTKIDDNVQDIILPLECIELELKAL